MVELPLTVVDDVVMRPPAELDDRAPPAPPLPSWTESELAAPHAARSPTPASEAPIHHIVFTVVTLAE